VNESVKVIFVVALLDCDFCGKRLLDYFSLNGLLCCPDCYAKGKLLEAVKGVV
jgi:hypothetical protein